MFFTIVVDQILSRSESVRIQQNNTQISFHHSIKCTHVKDYEDWRLEKELGTGTCTYRYVEITIPTVTTYSTE